MNKVTSQQAHINVDSDVPQFKPFGLIPSVLLFGLAALVFFVEIHWMIPILVRYINIEPIVGWFIVAGLGMFVPLLLVAFLILKTEGAFHHPPRLLKRLRFVKMTRNDWLWTIGAVVLIGVISVSLLKILEMFTGQVGHPPFFEIEPLSSDRYWLLAIWFPYWVLNIMGEEILWRGVILPRQEVSFGKIAWIFHGLCWGLFHIAFGWQLLVTLLPILFIQSFVVQKQKNTWIGVIIHSGLNGPSFLAIALGWM